MIKQCPAHCLLQLLPTYNLLWQEKCFHLMSGALWVDTSFCILVEIVSIVNNTVIRSGLSPVLPPVKDVKSDSFVLLFFPHPVWKQLNSKFDSPASTSTCAALRSSSAELLTAAWGLHSHYTQSNTTPHTLPPPISLLTVWSWRAEVTLPLWKNTLISRSS